MQHIKYRQPITPRQVYFRIWLSLLALTALTVAISILDLGAFTVFCALIIAAGKASLVLLHFMHLRHERPVIVYMVMACLGTFTIFMLLIYADYLFR
jgi:cytochrome c oxidase subunit 4